MNTSGEDVGVHQTKKVGNRGFTPPSWSSQAFTHKRKNICMWSKGHAGGKNSEDFCVPSACSWGGKSLCVLPPGPPLTHNAVLVCGNKYPKDNSKGWQRMKMKRRVGACCASEWGHGSAGSAVSPRCWLVFDVENSEWARFLMLCNFEDGVFEVMHELDSFPASSWFVFVFFTISFFSWSFFFFFLWEAQVMCLKWRNVSRVSAEAPIVVVVFAVLMP